MRTEKLHRPIPLIKHYITIHFPTISSHTSLGTGFRVSKGYMLCRISFIVFHYMACVSVDKECMSVAPTPF
jgi:hypothetical protein